MTIETEVAALTTATTTLLSAVNVAKSALDASTASASASAGIATTQAGTATTQAGIATTKAGEASVSAATASTHAGTAATQAGIATTKAGEANASAIAAAASEAATAVSIVTERTATATLTNKTLTSPDINGGTVDGAVIGGALPAAGSFTTLLVSTRITADVNVPEDNSAVLKNVSATGYGLYTRGGSGARYIAQFTNKDGVEKAVVTDTGLSVTGGISATGALTTAGLKEDASGNLGLGVVPSAWNSIYSAQQLGSSTSLWGIKAGAGGSYLLNNGYFNESYARIYSNSGFASEYSQLNGAHSWHTAPSGTAGQPISFTNAMKLTAEGGLLVGTTSGGAKVKIQHQDMQPSLMCLSDSASLTGVVLDLETLRATTDGTFNFIGCAIQGAAYRFMVRDSGNVVNTNNSYGAISDVKLKENITDATPKLDKLMQVRIVNYNLKTDPDHKQLGVIAQELEQVLPGLVEESPDRDKEGADLGTTTKSVKYSVFVPMLVKAMQEQQALIESLQTRLTALEGI